METPKHKPHVNIGKIVEPKKPETLYRKVAVSERLPEVSKWNIDYFLLEFDPPRKGMFEQGFVHNGSFIRTYTSGHSTINTPFDPQPTYWLEEIPTSQLQADKEELLEVLKYANRMLKNSKDAMYDENYIESLIQKHK